MIVICGGEWAEGLRHAPTVIGYKEPQSDTRETHGVCDVCARAANANITCRACGQVDTGDGLCITCEFSMERSAGAPKFLLTVFRQGDHLAGPYDGVGTVLRLREAMKHPEYRSFSLERLPAPVEAA